MRVDRRSKAHRRRRSNAAVTTRAVLTALALTIGASGCANGYERALLAQFFAASRLLDRTALQNIATVVFDPRTDGTVLRFDVERITPEDRHRETATVSARVRMPRGDIVQKHLIVTMRRTDPAVDTGVTSRWIVTSVAPQD
jgi:hypothetical protein